MLRTCDEKITDGNAHLRPHHGALCAGGCGLFLGQIQRKPQLIAPFQRLQEPQFQFIRVALALLQLQQRQGQQLQLALRQQFLWILRSGRQTP